MSDSPYATGRYATHDHEINRMVIEFNKAKTTHCGCSSDQAKSIPDLTTSLVKAWLIQETGGSDSQSMRAWYVDPAQVNVPGDWTHAKASLGLKKPVHRNEGTAKQNISAAIGLLTRKGFSRSGNIPPGATFDGWHTALRRYNGRNALTANGKPYAENYATRIVDRSQHMSIFTPIGLPRLLHTHHASQHPHSLNPNHQTHQEH